MPAGSDGRMKARPLLERNASRQREAASTRVFAALMGQPLLKRHVLRS